MGRELLRDARKQWVEERVQRYSEGLCPSFWHNEAHGVYSSCGTCSGTFGRHDAIAAERLRLEGFVKRAEEYARATGWTR